jgi:hypothetical protein
MTPADDVVEDEASECPCGVVVGRRGRDGSYTTAEDGDVDVAPVGEREAASKVVEGDGSKSTEEETVEKGVVPGQTISDTMEGTRNMKRTYIPPALKRRAGPMPPQVKDAVAKTLVDGQTKLSGASGVQIPAMLENIQLCTTVTTKQVTKAETSWMVNIMRGGIFM